MQGARTCASRDGRSFEEILQVRIVVVIQTAHGDTLAIALHFPAHIAVLAAIVSLDGETTGGVPFAVGVTNTGSPGRASSFWLSDGFLNRERSIPFLMLASPPLIRDKNRMR